VDGWQTEAVRYREGLSLVVRYTVTAREAATQDVRQRVFYAKGYPDLDTAARTFAHLQRLAEYSTSSELPRRFDAPLACFEHLQAVLLPATAGRPLSELLATAGDDELFEAVSESAHALSRFNLSDAPMARHFSARDYLEALQRPAGLLVRACPDLRPELEVIVAAVRALPAVDLGPTHRDMKPEHILVGPAGCTFIDLDSSAAADPVLDAALLLARFTALALDDGQRERMTAAGGIFAQEYFTRVPMSWTDRLPPYYAASLMEVAAGLFHRQAPNWRQHVPRLIATARGTVTNVT
jgi:hypothetical protein